MTTFPLPFTSADATLAGRSHCVETRADLHRRLHEEGLEVTVPEDRAEVRP